MPVPGALIRKTGMRKLDLCSAIFWSELKGQDGFSTLCPRISGDPRQLQQLVGNQFQKPSVMRVALPLEMRFEEKWNIHLPLHQEGAGFSKPLVKLLRPCPVYRTRARKHRALNDELKRAR